MLYLWACPYLNNQRVSFLFFVMLYFLGWSWRGRGGDGGKFSVAGRCPSHLEPLSLSECLCCWWLLCAGPVRDGEKEVWGDGALRTHTPPAGGVWGSGELTVTHGRRLHRGTVRLSACAGPLRKRVSHNVSEYFSHIWSQKHF